MNDSANAMIDFPRRMFALHAELDLGVGDRWLMVDPRWEPPAASSDDDEASDGGNDDPYAIGSRRSFVPVLGEITWELPKELASDVPFSAYVCQSPDGRPFGYVRVPHYSYDEHVIEAFESLIDRLEHATVAMVLDQVNNPGGSMFHMYALLSTLTDRALALPKHQITVDEDDAAIASEIVALAESGEAVPADERPSPELVGYSRFVLSEIEAGRGTGSTPTKPQFLNGIAEVLPAKSHYTKKIVVLINELDFSAAEFLAAILQDNKRATLFGERTAGAGGCVRRLTTTDELDQLGRLLGIEAVNVSWTMALRTNGQPIEGVGVHPDVRYSATEEDLRFGYAAYRRALLATMSAD